MAKVVSHQLITIETQIQSQANSCQICGGQSGTGKDTVDLRWLHFDDDGNGQFRCKLCGRSYRWRESLLRHLRVECGKEAQFQCPLCPIRTKHKHSLLRHVRKHVGSSFPSCL